MIPPGTGHRGHWSSGKHPHPLARLQARWDEEAARNPLLAAEPRPSARGLALPIAGATLLFVLAALIMAALP